MGALLWLAVALLVGTILCLVSDGESIILGIAGAMLIGFSFVFSFYIGKAYYEKRIPNIKIQVKAYEIQQKEAELQELREILNDNGWSSGTRPAKWC